MDITLLIAIFAGIAVLLILILYFRVQAFISLLISSIVVGIIAGMEPLSIMTTIQEGMGSTLGFVATVVGLGAMFGAILEHSGGAQALAAALLKRSKEKGTSWALMLTGFFVAIPVFFDVGFIILVPIIYSLQRTSGRSLLWYAVPLLAGLAVTHAFIPPTPGPVAVADILKADLGWVILFGFIVGIPTAIVTGPIFTKYIAKRIFVAAPELLEETDTEHQPPSVAMIITIIGLPIFLIVVNTLLNSDLMLNSGLPPQIASWMKLIGHPFMALIIANLIAWYWLGIRRGVVKEVLFNVTGKSLAPAGVIILLTGAGGAFKQMLINTGAGAMLAEYFAELGLGMLLFAFIVAALVRILQGSTTVAMITAAGVVAPVISADLGDIDKALLVLSIAAGACILSHVNDSGFWLVSKYLGLSEKQTLRTWSVATTILALVGFTCVSLISLFF